MKSQVANDTITNRELDWCYKLSDNTGWPISVIEAAFEVFGYSLFNQQSRTFKSLNRRIVHALQVWEEKYGPFSEEQEKYAAKVLAWAVQKGASEAGEGAPNSRLFPYVLHLLAGVVNAERTDAGFKRRALLSGEFPLEALTLGVFKSVPR